MPDEPLVGEVLDAQDPGATGAPPPREAIPNTPCPYTARYLPLGDRLFQEITVEGTGSIFDAVQTALNVALYEQAKERAWRRRQAQLDALETFVASLPEPEG